MEESEMEEVGEFFDEICVGHVKRVAMTQFAVSEFHTFLGQIFEGG